MPGSHFKELASLLRQVLPPDTTGETLSQLCAQVAVWMFRSTAPNKEAALIKELESMGVKLEPGGPGSLGTFKVEV